VIRVYDEAGNVIETQEHAGEFQDVVKKSLDLSRKRIKQARFAAYVSQPL